MEKRVIVPAEPQPASWLAFPRVILPAHRLPVQAIGESVIVEQTSGLFGLL